MQKQISGIIVASVVEPIGDTDMKEGFITVQISGDEYVQLDVGSYTQYDILDEGAKVCIEIETLGDTSILYAKRVVLVNNSV